MVSPVLATDVEHFVEQGWLLTRSHDEVDAVRAWVDEVAAWPDDGPWLHHRELTDAGPQLCRTENFVPYHEGLCALLTSGAMLDTASALLGEPAVLYKEKINYKLPGGAGYSPHQDAPAYRFVDTHVSCMVAVDDALVGNGCLEVVSAGHQELLPTDDTGCIRADVVDALEWVPVEVRAGETLWFHSRTPHRSGPNLGSTPRRALYPTYNARREGDLREAYYEQKAAELAGGSAVSLIGDFQGEDRVSTAVSVDDVLALYAQYGSRQYDEALSQLAHAEQTAALARAAGASDEVVVAALLHDVGHLLEMADRDGARDRSVDHRHEAVGAAWLASLYGPGVTAPIALHVRAKRYLCAVEPTYHDGLSAGSVASLERQGGPLTSDEATAFEANPGWEGAVALRRWDDEAKVLDLEVAPIETYRPLLEQMVSR